MRAALAVATAAAAVAAACAIPGRAYRVSPAIDGRVAGERLDGAQLELEARSRSTASLGARRALTLEADGDGEALFHFDPVMLKVAGLEYDKTYLARLRYENADGEMRILWRAEWYRGDLGDRPVRLDCDLARSTQLGQPCWVEDAAQHKWLVQRGELEFLRSCASCHGVGAVGGGPAAQALASTPPDLTRIAARRGGRFDRAEVLAWIDGRVRAAAHGSDEMPIWGRRLAREYADYPDADDMAAARIDAIVTYLESIQRPAGSP